MYRENMQALIDDFSSYREEYKEAKEMVLNEKKENEISLSWELWEEYKKSFFSEDIYYAKDAYMLGEDLPL